MLDSMAGLPTARAMSYPVHDAADGRLLLRPLDRGAPARGRRGGRSVLKSRPPTPEAGERGSPCRSDLVTRYAMRSDEAANENQRRVEGVFAELADTAARQRSATSSSGLADDSLRPRVVPRPRRRRGEPDRRRPLRSHTSWTATPTRREGDVDQQTAAAASAPTSRRSSDQPRRRRGHAPTPSTQKRSPRSVSSAAQLLPVDLANTRRRDRLVGAHLFDRQARLVLVQVLARQASLAVVRPDEAPGDSTRGTASPRLRPRSRSACRSAPRASW